MLAAVFECCLAGGEGGEAQGLESRVQGLGFRDGRREVQGLESRG